jgi:hypothetical protein
MQQCIIGFIKLGWTRPGKVVPEVLKKNSEKAFSPQKRIKKLMVTSESAPRKLSNEWSCQ